MAAVLPNLEVESDALQAQAEAYMAEGETPAQAVKTVEKKKKEPHAFKPPPVEKSHNELTRLYWSRRLVAGALANNRFTIEQDAGDFYIRFAKPLPVNLVPWRQTNKPIERVQLFSSNSKMRCPTFDLPAGSQEVGGACPAAAAAQSTTEQNILMDEPFAMLTMTKFAVIGSRRIEQKPMVIDPKYAVCRYCYASGGKYGESIVQVAEVARFMLVQAAMKDERLKAKLFDLLRYVIPRLKYVQDESRDASARWGIRPIRIHGSGDFFTPAYAAFWIDVANQVGADEVAEGRVPNIRFWAPTRTQTTWGDKWEALLNRMAVFADSDGRQFKNFSIRPSGYSIGDPAPYMPGAGPLDAGGTSVLSSLDSVTPGKEGGVIISGRMANGLPIVSSAGEGYFDWQCGVYALNAGDKTCAKAVGPDGEVGCRACWVQPQLRVNYVVH
jgi:hypothetical protein